MASTIEILDYFVSYKGFACGAIARTSMVSASGITPDADTHT
jgi:hypothetical protein